jgi:hypothetical protein
MNDHQFLILYSSFFEREEILLRIDAHNKKDKYPTNERIENVYDAPALSKMLRKGFKGAIVFNDKGDGIHKYMCKVGKVLEFTHSKENFVTKSSNWKEIQSKVVETVNEDKRLDNRFYQTRNDRELAEAISLSLDANIGHIEEFN